MMGANMRPWIGLIFLAGGMTVVCPAQAQDKVTELLQQARAALMKGQKEEALVLIDKAMTADPKNTTAYVLRAAVRDAERKHAEALVDLSKAIELDAKLAEAYDRRGSVHFKLGKFAESLADFDKFLEMRPQDAPGHWRRGITCYYAGKFDEGKKQFEGYEKVDTNDVENAVWHFICTARAHGVEKARASLLKIGKDKRVPMMEVYALFAGKAKPEDVLAASQAGKPAAEVLNRQLFYAHQYLGLYFEVTGDPKKTLEHTALAAEKYRIPHYMGDVAAVHLEVLRKAKK
jgi:lipoprotein NlpI